MQKTPLYESHKKLSAKIVDFAGWQMPVQYKGVLEEHQAVRQGVGLFDVSHMGEILVTGENAQAYINYITTHDIRKIKDGQCQYSACCYEDGGIVDDVITYRFNTNKYLIIVNAANVQKDFEWFKKNNKFNVSIENKSQDYYQLALQGPLAQKLLSPLVDVACDQLASFKFCETTLRGKKIILSRTGYTGEDGFEIYGDPRDAVFVWETLLQEGEPYHIQPIGLAARDTLRLEVAYSLYGHELSPDINPLEARLGWVVKLDKSEFLGQKALLNILQQGVKRQMVGLQMIDPGIPRQGYSVFVDECPVGVITSGTFSPSLRQAIGLALIENDCISKCNNLSVEIRNQKRQARIIKLPFYKAH